MKECFRGAFSDQNEINHWENIYSRKDFRGACYRARMNQALSWLDGSDLSRQSLILDAGCGPGVLTREIAERGHIVYGMDYSLGMIERAQKNCKIGGKHNVEFLLGDIELLPFKNSNFDMVLCLGVVSYLGSEKRALRELSRILKPGGTLILSICNRTRLVNRLDLPLFITQIFRRTLGHRIASLGNRSETEKGVSGRSYFIPNLANSLKRQGYELLEYKTVPIGLLTFLGREIPLKKTNIRITMLLERLQSIPIVGSFGGMCLFKAKKPH